jgi:hypothetical protein
MGLPGFTLIGCFTAAAARPSHPMARILGDDHPAGESRSRIQHPVPAASAGNCFNRTPWKIHVTQLHLEPGNHLDGHLGCFIICAAPRQLAQLGPRERPFVSMLDQNRQHEGFHWEELDPVSQTGRAHVVDDEPFDEVKMQIAITEGAEGRCVAGLGHSIHGPTVDALCSRPDPAVGRVGPATSPHGRDGGVIPTL